MVSNESVTVGRFFCYNKRIYVINAPIIGARILLTGTTL